MATSPQVGVSCTHLEGGGHRLTLPHSKAGPELSGPALAVRGPLADLGESISSLPSSPVSEGISERTFGQVA